MKRFHYIVTNHSSTRIDEDSPFRVASAQIRAKNMDHALEIVIQSESITREIDPRFKMKDSFELYRQGKRVGVYISPIADDMES